jgi:hypothetical protein
VGIAHNRNSNKKLRTTNVKQKYEPRELNKEFSLPPPTTETKNELRKPNRGL